MDKRNIGKFGEEIGVNYLTEKGLTILARNFGTRHGEIDIVALEGDTIVFAEVKYRGDGAVYDPLAAVTKSKQKSIIGAARVYLYTHHYSETTPVRFDCIGIRGTEINWIKNAFEAY